MKNRITSWLKEIRQDLKFNQQGICSLTYNHHLECNIEINPDHSWLYFHSPVYLVREQEDKEFYLKILKINLFFPETDGASLGFDTRSRYIVLNKRYILENLSREKFLNGFNRFIDISEKLHQRINGKDFLSGGSLPGNKPAIDIELLSRFCKPFSLPEKPRR